MAPTNAQILLYAVQAAIESDIRKLQALSHQHKLNPELVLRILLTFLPEGTDPAIYLPLLHDIATGLPELHPDDATASSSPSHSNDFSVSPDEARRRAKNLQLQTLHVDDHIQFTADDSLPQYFVSFILLRARRVDYETGSLRFVQQVVEPFIRQSSFLRLWMGSTLLPLIRLNYEFYSERDEPISLDDFEQLRGGAALDALIGGGVGGCTTPEEYVRDLKFIVSPWLQGEIYRHSQRQKTRSNRDGTPATGNTSAVVAWGWFDNWLLHVAMRDPQTAVGIVCSDEWNGPGPVDPSVWVGEDPLVDGGWMWGTTTRSSSAILKQVRNNYSRTCMCLFYTTQDASEEGFEVLERLLIRIAECCGCEGVVATILHGNDASYSISAEAFARAKAGAQDMGSAALMSGSSFFTSLGEETFSLAAWYLKFSLKLLSLDIPLQLSRTVQVSLLGTANEQRALLQQYLQILHNQKIDDAACSQLHANITLMHNHPSCKTGATTVLYGVWSQLESEEIDIMFLKALVTTGRHKLAVATYLSDSQPLSKDVVESDVLHVALSTYDGATNGNKTRGGVKKTSDIISAFSQHFPLSAQFSRFEALIRATHALSFYALVLQHGVTCAPINIRTQTQPLSLIDKVLEQNKDAYTSLDDLTRISADLARAGLVVLSSGRLSGSYSTHDSQSAPAFFTIQNDNLESTLQAVTQAIASKAIRASLSAGDFDTAYSYITTRLAGKAAPDTYESIDDENTLWRTALAAGRFEPRNEARSGPKYLRRLEQKMELLASALELAPAPALAQVLEAWQECEGQVNATSAKENEAQLAWDDSGNKRSSVRVAAGDRHLPGGFGSEAWVPNAEGTGGRKWAGGEDEAPMGLFDVARGAAAALQKSAFTGKGAARSGAKGQGQESHDDEDAHERVRKRDMVSSAVTSGLVSGIGWVIGAKPSQE